MIPAFPVHSISIAGTQVRAALNEQLVTDYAERMTAGDIFPPIVVFHDGEVHHLADGFHRLRAAERLGRQTIAAEVVVGSQAEALWFALGANRTHGARLTLRDKEHAIILALPVWPEKSARQLADQLGCTDVYVSRVRRQVQTSLHLPDRVTGRDGKSYPASIPKAGARQLSPQRVAVIEMVQAGKSSNEIHAALGAHSELIADVRRVLGVGGIDKTRSAIAERRERMRTMAGEGYTSRQIAAAVGVGGDSVRKTLKQEGVEIPADKAVGGTHKHDPNRILTRIVMDAENLLYGAELVDFRALDRSQFPDWLKGLKHAREHLSTFIRQLQEHVTNGEAA